MEGILVNIKVLINSEEVCPQKLIQKITLAKRDLVSLYRDSDEQLSNKRDNRD